MAAIWGAASWNGKNCIDNLNFIAGNLLQTWDESRRSIKRAVKVASVDGRPSLVKTAGYFPAAYIFLIDWPAAGKKSPVAIFGHGCAVVTVLSPYRTALLPALQPVSFNTAHGLQSSFKNLFVIRLLPEAHAQFSLCLGYKDKILRPSDISKK